jgi:hypothetical protein
MAHEVVRVVTQPFHGADGIEVLYSPGDRVPVDADLPDGLRTALAVAEVADDPEPEAADDPEPEAAPRSAKVTAKTATAPGKT